MEAVEEWFHDEEEGFANLGAKNRAQYQYEYHAWNHAHGFQYLPETRFSHVLSIGGAYGEELHPLLYRTDRVTILEPCEAFFATEIMGVPVEYVKPRVSGKMPFLDEAFDLITCFGCLHHIPNVSTVIGEAFRCLRDSGFALIREPIISMGDWRKPRRGLTRRERGIPLPIFREIIGTAGFTILKQTQCGFSLIPRLGTLLKGHVYNSTTAVKLDTILSRLFAWNDRYHPVTPWQKLKPTAVAYVLRKPGGETRRG